MDIVHNIQTIVLQLFQYNYNSPFLCVRFCYGLDLLIFYMIISIETNELSTEYSTLPMIRWKFPVRNHTKPVNSRIQQIIRLVQHSKQWIRTS